MNMASNIEEEFIVPFAAWAITITHHSPLETKFRNQIRFNIANVHSVNSVCKKRPTEITIQTQKILKENIPEQRIDCIYTIK